MFPSCWLYQVCLTSMLIPCLFCLLLLSLAIPSVSSRRHNDGVEDEIGRYISVDCSQKGMKVSLDYNLSRHRSTMTSSLADRLSRCTVNIGSLDGCDSSRDSLDKQHSVYTDYSKCGVAQQDVSYGTNYSAKVVVNVDPSSLPSVNTMFMFGVSCTVLKEPLTQTRFELLRDYRRVDTTGDSLEMPLNSQMVMEIQPLFSVLTGVNDIFTYPSKCWLSSVSSPTNRVVLLDKGCPVRKGSHVLSSIYQTEALQYTATSTNIYVNTIKDIIPVQNRNLSNPIVKLEFHCEVFFCSSNADHRILDVPMCPSAAPCDSSSVSVQPSLAGGQGGGNPSRSLPRTVISTLPLPIHLDVSRDGGRRALMDPVKQPDAPPKEPTVPSIPSAFMTPMGALLAFIAGIVVGCFCSCTCTCWSRFRTQPLLLKHCHSPATVSQADRELAAAYSDADNKLLVNGAP